MSQHDQPRSLLSLSIAAADVPPMPPGPPAESAVRSSQGKPPDALWHPTSHATAHTSAKHRRLSSVGRSRRRLSDARDAATRPFPTSLQTASASLAALSLSSPTVSHRPVNGTLPVQVAQATLAMDVSDTEPTSVDDTHHSLTPPQSHTPLASHGTRPTRKRGTTFICESCSKVYRHPSCLIKHRWEHTPQWQEASKFVLSKHQQVQLLEAAAILSHLSPSSASLPEDRSLWPSFLSGGLVPPPGIVTNNRATPSPTAHASPHPMSSSVPASTHMDTHVSTVEPHLHLRSLQTPQPVSVPATTEDDALNLLALRLGSPVSVSVPVSRTRTRGHGHGHAHAHSHPLSVQALERARCRSDASAGYACRPSAGWALPSSSVRSKSGSSRSRSQSQSASESRSDDERAYGYGYVHACEDGDDVQVGYGDEMEYDRVERDKGVEEWDGIEMEMEMA